MRAQPRFLNPEHLIYGETSPETRETPGRQFEPVLFKHLLPSMTEPDRLLSWRDSTGHTPTCMPHVLLPSVTAIIRDRTYLGDVWRVLVHQRRDNGHWGFLGGGQHIGERIADTVHREVREESGIDITIDRLVAIDSDPQTGALCSYPDGNVVHYTNLSFACWYDHGEIRCSDESILVRWATTDSLPEPFLAPHLWRLTVAQSVCRGGEIQVR